MTAWLRQERRAAWALVSSLSMAILALGLVFHGEAQAPAGTVEGMVRDASGPVAGARVRVRNTENATLTDEDGLFSLGGLDEGLKIEVTAWDDGYYITKLAKGGEGQKVQKEDGEYKGNGKGKGDGKNTSGGWGAKSRTYVSSFVLQEA